MRRSSVSFANAEASDIATAEEEEVVCLEIEETESEQIIISLIDCVDEITDDKDVINDNDIAPVVEPSPLSALFETTSTQYNKPYLSR